MEQDPDRWLGIDFGTTNSCMAWVNPDTGKPEPIKSAQRVDKTPSVVYYDPDTGDVLVGVAAANVLNDLAGADADERQRVESSHFASIKRDLDAERSYALSDDRLISPVDIVAKILKKLKQDAENLCFHGPVERAVITHPVAFRKREKTVLEEAARRAGFAEVRFLDEPVAAAMGFAVSGTALGQGILVYDLGGGTFDVAFVHRDGDDGFYVPVTPDGDPACGGDDFDRTLLSHIETQLLAEHGEDFDPHSLSRHFLKLCREAKEVLTFRSRATITAFLAIGEGMKRVRVPVTRETFESLAQQRIDETVAKTKGMLKTVENSGHQVDTIVLIGGSSQIPLVGQRLGEVLPLEPTETMHSDIAVALGAALFGKQCWSSVESMDDVYAKAMQLWEEEKHREAHSFLAQAAEQGHADAQYNLALCYENGWGVAVNEAEVAKWYRKAARQGHADAQCSLGSCYEYGRGVSANQREAAKWYRKAAKQGHAIAQCSLGSCYKDGRGVSQKMPEAAKWYRKAAEQGHAEAQHQLGMHGKDGDDSAASYVSPPGKITGKIRLGEHSSQIHRIVVSADGCLGLSGSIDGAVHLWDLRKQRELRRLEWHQARVSALAFSPDGERAISGSFDRKVRVWDLRSGTPLNDARFDHWVCAASFLPDGRHMLTAGCDQMVYLRDTADFEDVTYRQIGSAAILNLGISSDGKQALAWLADNTVYRLPLSDRKILRVRQVGEIDGVLLIASLPKEWVVISATGDGMIHVRRWASRSIQPASPSAIGGHANEVLGVTLRPDGAALLSWSRDGTVRLWNLRSGEEVWRLSQHKPLVTSAAFALDGLRVLVGDEDGGIHMMAVPANLEKPDLDSIRQGTPPIQGPGQRAKEQLEAAVALAEQLGGIAADTDEQLENRQQIFQQALQAAQAACDLEPLWSQAFFIKAYILEQDEQWSAADAALTACLRFVPGHQEAYLRRAICRFHLDRYAEAKSDCDQDARMAPVSGTFLVRALANCKLNDFTAAAADLREAVGAPDRRFDAYALETAAGLLLLKLTDPPSSAVDEALQAFGTALQDMPPSLSDEQCQKFGVLFIDFDIEDTLIEVTTGYWQSRTMADPLATTQKGLLNACRQRYSTMNRKAVALFEQHNSGRPVSKQVWAGNAMFAYYEASVAVKRGSEEDAVQWLSELLEEDPEFDIRRVRRDATLKRSSRGGAIDEFLSPNLSYEEQHGSVFNNLTVTNASPFSVHNLRVTVTVDRSDGQPDQQFTKSEYILKAGESKTWNDVFEDAGWFGGNISQVDVTLFCAEQILSRV